MSFTEIPHPDQSRHEREELINSTWALAAFLDPVFNRDKKTWKTLFDVQLKKVYENIPPEIQIKIQESAQKIQITYQDSGGFPMREPTRQLPIIENLIIFGLETRNARELNNKLSLDIGERLEATHQINDHYALLDMFTESFIVGATLATEAQTIAAKKELGPFYDFIQSIDGLEEL